MCSLGHKLKTNIKSDPLEFDKIKRECPKIHERNQVEGESGSELETRDPMRSTTDDTPSPNKNKVEDEVMGSRPNRCCVTYQSTHTQKYHVLEEDMNSSICLGDPNTPKLEICLLLRIELCRD
jgi:hypothetical protein